MCPVQYYSAYCIVLFFTTQPLFRALHACFTVLQCIMLYIYFIHYCSKKSCACILYSIVQYNVLNMCTVLYCNDSPVHASCTYRVLQCIVQYTGYTVIIIVHISVHASCSVLQFIVPYMFPNSVQQCKSTVWEKYVAIFIWFFSPKLYFLSKRLEKNF